MNKVPKRPPAQPLGSIYGHIFPGEFDVREYERETRKLVVRLLVVWGIAFCMISFIWGAVVEHYWPHILAGMY